MRINPSPSLSIIPKSERNLGIEIDLYEILRVNLVIRRMNTFYYKRRSKYYVDLMA